MLLKHSEIRQLGGASRTKVSYCTLGSSGKQRPSLDLIYQQRWKMALGRCRFVCVIRTIPRSRVDSWSEISPKMRTFEVVDPGEKSANDYALNI